MSPRPLSRALLLAAALACVGLAPGQGPDLSNLPPTPRRAPAAFDPSDVYYQGWLLSKDAEKLDSKGQHLEALDKLRRARGMFQTIRRTFPEWKPDMVDLRMKATEKAITEVTPGAIEEQRAKTEAIAELEGGARRGGSAASDSPTRLDTGLPATPVQPRVELKSLESRRIADLEAEVDRLKRQIRAASTPRNVNPNNAARESARATAIERQRDLATAQLHRAQTELEQLRRRSAQEPMQGELRGLNNRIASLEKEKAVMGRALESSRSETQRAKAQVDALLREQARLSQDVADLKQNLEVERRAANEVVAGQRKQLEHMQKLLTEKSGELNTANQRIASLETELAEVRDSFNEMREERDGLLRERDQMAALLNLNEGGQLQQVIDQNMALDRQLREAEQRYETLKGDYDATAADLKEALTDLTISKIRIQQFRRERTEQEQRMEELEARLQREDRNLATSEADPAEVAVLRGVIDRQLKIQRKRREATELLLETFREKAKSDPELERAFDLLEGNELNLSPEELAIVDGQEADDVFISPEARPRSEVERSIAAREAELVPYEKAGVRAFQNGRLRAAREAFEMIIERNPADSTAMCKLGLVEYKLDPQSPAAAEMFRRATEIDPRNPYAHRMLGHTLDVLGNHVEALHALERSAELAPNQAETHLLMGNAQYRLGNLQGAEEAFRTASACDETLAEPPYNLAMLYARTGDRKRGLESYRRALELGAAPNLELEKRLGKRD